MLKTNDSETDRIHYIQLNPWLFDENLTDEERLYWKLKGVCHSCGIDPHYHRDDCIYSANQQMLFGLNTGILTLDSYTMQLHATKK